MDKIRTIIRKEWAEVFKNRLVLFTVLLLPLFFSVMPLVALYFTNSEGAGGVSNVPPQMASICGDLGYGACIQVYVLYQFVIIFMMLPLIIPASISAYSIVGEKTTRCLEPLLATPITTMELLIGKALGSIIPAVAATWGGFAVFAVGARLITSNPAVAARVLDPIWLLTVFVVGPLLSVASVSVSIMVSSRVSDPRTAEQVSMVIIVPLLAVFFGQTAGLFTINITFLLAVLVVLLAADATLVYFAGRLFERETILTRWK